MPESRWTESADKFLEQVAKQKSHEQLDEAATTLELKTSDYSNLSNKGDKIRYLLSKLQQQ
jgi:hypothetical protein